MAKPNTAIFSLPATGYHGQVITSNHTFLVDEPEKVGGTNKAPNPTNYLLGALASCTAITLRMFAERKNWELGKIRVGTRLREKLKQDGSRVFAIRKDIVLENTSITEEQKTELLRIAAKCPVSVMLGSQVELQENIVEDLEQVIVKEYKNEDITVVWKPNLCIHSKKCWKGLLPVFNPQKKPWVHMDGASTEKIINQVNQCPSGALSFYEND